MELDPKELSGKKAEIMMLIRRYRVLRARQIRDRLLPGDNDSSQTRAHLRNLVGPGWLRKYQPKLVDPLSHGSAPPVYTMTTKGGSMMAAITGNTNFLVDSEVSFSNWMSANHWASLSSLAMLIDDAFAEKDYVKLTAMHFEYDIGDASERDPAKRFILYERLGEKVVFAPDMAIETDVKGHRRAWYSELEMGSDSPARVAAKKHKGIAAFAASDRLPKQFPLARDFRVVVFCPNPGWRDILRKEMKGKPGQEFWMFCATSELTAERLLHEPLLYSVDKGPFPMLPRPT